MHVSARSVADAATVRDKGTKALWDGVQKGKIAVSTAAKLVTAPVEVQRQAIAEPKKAHTLAKEEKARAKPAATAKSDPPVEWPAREPWKMEAALLRIIGTQMRSLPAAKQWAAEALHIDRPQPGVTVCEGFRYPNLPASESAAKAEGRKIGWPPVPHPTKPGLWRWIPE